MDPPVPKGAIVRRASSFFGFSFLWSAAINIVPQGYLLAVAPERKSLVLAALLLLGTLAAWAGVELSRRHRARGRRLSPGWLIAATLAYALPLFVVVGRAEGLLVYCAMFMAFRFASNWLFNMSDNTLVGAAGPAGAGTHASAAVGFQIAGNMAGPIVFALLASQINIALAVTSVVVVWTGLAVVDAARRSEPTKPEPAPGSTGAWADLSHAGRLFVVHCLLVQTAVVGMFAQLIFLVGDWLLLDQPERVGGLLITGIGLTSLATIAISSLRRRERAPRRGLIVAALLAAAAILVLAAKPPPLGLIVVALLAGVGGGRFMLLSRTIASSWSGPVGREGMLGRYNNLSNLASVFVFTILTGAAAVLGEGHWVYNPAMLGLFAALLGAGALVIARVPADTELGAAGGVDS